MLNQNRRRQIAEENKTAGSMSALDAYLNRVYKYVVLVPTSVAATSAVVYTISKFVGWYDDVSGIGLFFFDLTNIIYFCIAMYFFKTGLAGDEEVKRQKLKKHKIAVGIVIMTQFNFTAYLIPYRQWWVFAPFFIAFTVFFFDMKLTSWVSAGVLLSTFLSWFIRKDVLWEPRGKYMCPNILFRISYLSIFTFLLLSLTYFGGKYLVEELEKYANYDTLTHLLNRRSMDNYLHEAKAQAETGRSSFCILMADIDDFKRVNDTYGHDCGDEVLKHVAHTIMTGVNKTDNVFRWGGEEICILLKATEEQAVAVAERIRLDIENDSLNYRDETVVSVTLTMGISPYKSGMTIQEMMDDADAKLYWGKKHGKNRVVSVLPEE